MGMFIADVTLLDLRNDSVKNVGRRSVLYTASLSEEEVLQREQHFCYLIFIETIESLTSASYIHSFVLGM